MYKRQRLGRAAARAWDGQWFLRGYFDDGAPLGSSKGRACRIDSVAQSWAAFCAEAPPERVDVYKRQLYNWYDTRSLRPLAPKYVSTVDSGNFAACLAALRRGLEDYARPDLAARAGALYEAMDFRPLYDAERRLFRIGWDESAQKLSDGLYDLLSSEARLTGYLAVARGEAPRRHWRRLSRALVSKDRCV